VVSGGIYAFVVVVLRHVAQSMREETITSYFGGSSSEAKHKRKRKPTMDSNIILFTVFLGAGITVALIFIFITWWSFLTTTIGYFSLSITLFCFFFSSGVSSTESLLIYIIYNNYHKSYKAKALGCFLT